MAATVWKGYLTFGLISVPIRLFAAARREHVSLHQVHKVRAGGGAPEVRQPRLHFG